MQLLKFLSFFVLRDFLQIGSLLIASAFYKAGFKVSFIIEIIILAQYIRVIYPETRNLHVY